jgi:hypothetical protein
LLSIAEHYCAINQQNHFSTTWQRIPRCTAVVLGIKREVTRRISTKKKKKGSVEVRRGRERGLNDWGFGVEKGRGGVDTLER